MKNRKLLILSSIPMLLLTSCDKEISKEEAQVKAASIQTAQENATYNTFETTVKLSYDTSGGYSSDVEMKFGVDFENKFAYFKHQADYADSQTKETGKRESIYCAFIDSEEGFIETAKLNEDTQYKILSTDETKYDELFQDVYQELSYYAKGLQTYALDAESVLQDIADNKGLEGSMDSVLGEFDYKSNFKVSYSIKYFSNSSSSFGVSRE